MYRVYTEDLGKKPYKMMERHELSEHHGRMRAERSRHNLNEVTQGTLSNLVFTDVKKFDIQQVVNHQNDHVWSFSSSVERRIVTRRQNAVCHGLGSCDSHGKISACFCALWGQTKHRTVHFSYFGIKYATMHYKNFSGFTMESATGYMLAVCLRD
ncbi:hypothetical protein FHG87_017884 [Trinorchestia longiramus]|nr:hypothetical protein FHG87_017884 [Trinorchestia longiramus]